MNLKEYFIKAQKEKWALGQFNFSTLEQLKGILMAAKNLRSPIILGTSEGESNFLGLSSITSFVYNQALEIKINPKTIFLNLDHAKQKDLIKKAINTGYQMIHSDNSDLSFDENLKKTKEITMYIHKKEVLTEGGLGHITQTLEIYNLTNPEQVEEFVKKTNIDILAIALGNVHGVYKQMPKLDFKRLKEIRNKTNVFLTLHGGSGISHNEIKKAINFGVTKININTEIRKEWKKSLFKQLKTKEIRPYKILSYVAKDIQKLVEKKIKLFGSCNKI